MKNIHIIPTHKPSKLVKRNLGLIRVADNFTKSDLDFILAEFVNIYITNDEKPEEGDWLLIIDDFETYVHEHKGDNLPTTYHKKIILTTDINLIKDEVQAIDDEFLEWFVKNPTYEGVYIIKQYKQVNQDNPITRGSTALMFSHYEIHLLKATKQMIDEWNLIYCKLNNRQIPTKEKPTQEIINEDFSGGLDMGQIVPKEERTYTEEDVKNAFLDGWQLRDGDLPFPKAKKKWFNEFKNK